MTMLNLHNGTNAAKWEPGIYKSTCVKEPNRFIILKTPEGIFYQVKGIELELIPKVWADVLTDSYEKIG
jgi:hypothetical protein